MQKAVRDKPRYLSNEEKFRVAEYMITHKGVYLKYDDKQELCHEYRVGKSKLANEISIEVCKVTPAHLDGCMELYYFVSKVSNQMPEIPKEDTKSPEFLKLQEDYKLLQEERDLANKNYINVRARLTQIKRLVNV